MTTLTTIVMALSTQVGNLNQSINPASQLAQVGGESVVLRQNLGVSPNSYNSIVEVRQYESGSFTADSNYTLTQIEVALNKNSGSPLTNPVTAYIYSDSSGHPGSILGTSINTLSDVLTSGYAYYSFQFAGVALVNGTRYHVVLKAAIDASNYPNWGMLTGQAGQQMYYSVSNGTTWVLDSDNGQAAIKTYSAATVSVPAISSFVASPSSVPQGNSSTLSWSVSGNPTPTLSINNGVGTVSGTSISVSPSVTTTYTLTATNSQGSAQAQTIVTVTASPPLDTTSPSIPSGLSATAVSSSQINLTWSASTDPSVAGQVTSGVTGYRIYRGGVQIGTSATNSYSNTGLTPSTAYSYTISAYDTAGNNSSQSSSASATTQAAGAGINCDLATLQAAVNVAARNATITCNAGTWTWSGTLSITKGLSLIGAGRGNTILRGSDVIIEILPDTAAIANEEIIRVIGFTFDGNNSALHLIETVGAGPTASKPFRNLAIGDNTFRNGGTSTSGGGIISTAGQVRGVIYNNIFDRVNVVLKVMGNDDTTEWSNGHFPFAFGNSDNLFFEGNTIQYSSSFSGQDPGWTETGQGGRLALRYNSWNMANTTQSELWDAHGFQYMPGGQTGTMISEYYGNTITNAKGYRWVNHRGSWGLYFNNILTGTGGMGIEANVYSCTANVPGASGVYKAEVNNTYVFNNTNNGAAENMGIGATGGGCGVNENDEFYNYNPSFNGTTGIGRGTSAPTGSCAVGTAYWKASTPTPTVNSSIIQSGTLYKCTAPNTWTAYYTPYTYPHPLQGATSPPPPTQYTLTSSASTGGTISPQGLVSITSGSSQTFTITPNAGYQVASVIVDSSQVGAVTSYTFNNVTGNHTISVAFTPTTPIVGDLNSDGLVNSIDLSLLITRWNTNYSAYDLNSDGLVNSLDYVVMVLNWSL